MFHISTWIECGLVEVNFLIHSSYFCGHEYKIIFCNKLYISLPPPPKKKIAIFCIMYHKEAAVWTSIMVDLLIVHLHNPWHNSFLEKYHLHWLMAFTCLPFGFATSPQEFTKLLRPVKKARYQAAHLLGRLADLCRYSRTGPAACPDDHQFAPVSRLDHQLREVRSDTQPGLWGFMGMQFNTRQFTAVALPKMPLKVQSVHQHWMTNPVITARDLHRLLGILVFMATLVPQGRLRLRPVQWWAPPQLGAWGPETGLTGSQFLSGVCQRWPGGHLQQFCRIFLSSPGKRKSLTSRMGPARVGRPVRVTLDTGTVVSISKIMAHQCSGDAGRHQRHESFPSSSEIQAGSLDVRQRSHSCLPTSRTWGGHPTLWCSWCYACWSGAIARR